MQISPRFGNQQALQQQREQNRQMIEDQLAAALPQALGIVQSSPSGGDYARNQHFYANTVLSNYLEATSPQRLNRMG